MLQILAEAALAVEMSIALKGNQVVCVEQMPPLSFLDDIVATNSNRVAVDVGPIRLERKEHAQPGHRIVLVANVFHVVHTIVGHFVGTRRKIVNLETFLHFVQKGWVFFLSEFGQCVSGNDGPLRVGNENDLFDICLCDVLFKGLLQAISGRNESSLTRTTPQQPELARNTLHQIKQNGMGGVVDEKYGLVKEFVEFGAILFGNGLVGGDSVYINPTLVVVGRVVRPASSMGGISLAIFRVDEN